MDHQVLLPYPVDFLRLVDFDVIDQFIEHPGGQGLGSSVFADGGDIIYTDTADIKAFTSELSAIGRNINQIAKRINATGSPYQADMEEIRERLDQIWQLQRRILSSQR